MNISKFIARKCVQTAVYWGNPVNDGENHFTFNDPIEIFCRWEGKVQIVKDWDAKGGEVECTAMIYVLQDLDKEGFLFLGTLDDLLDSSGDSSGDYYDPMKLDEAYRIKQFEKIPALGSTTEFIRVAYLSQQSYR
jgi:hypothetical protein